MTDALWSLTIRCMGSLLTRVWRVILAFADDVLPMSPEERARRDDDGRDHSHRRRLWLKLHLLQKRGRGGYR